VVEDLDVVYLWVDGVYVKAGEERTTLMTCSIISDSGH